jgi:hypothetical protein
MRPAFWYFSGNFSGKLDNDQKNYFNKYDSIETELIKKIENTNEGFSLHFFNYYI